MGKFELVFHFYAEILANNVISIYPDDEFVHDKEYMIIALPVQDYAGNAMRDEVVSSFTTIPSTLMNLSVKFSWALISEYCSGNEVALDYSVIIIGRLRLRDSNNNLLNYYKLVSIETNQSGTNTFTFTGLPPGSYKVDFKEVSMFYMSQGLQYGMMKCKYEWNDGSNHDGYITKAFDSTQSPVIICKTSYSKMFMDS